MKMRILITQPVALSLSVPVGHGGPQLEVRGQWGGTARAIGGDRRHGLGEGPRVVVGEALTDPEHPVSRSDDRPRYRIRLGHH